MAPNGIAVSLVVLGTVKFDEGAVARPFYYAAPMDGDRGVDQVAGQGA
jgi:hypothetical protein